MARLTTEWYWPVNNTLAGNTEIVRPWNDLYQGIERANLCIDQIPKMEQYTGGTAADQKKLYQIG